MNDAINAVLTVLVGLLVLGGGLFYLLACLGLIRLPDTFTRLHAASMASTFGIGFMLLAVAFHAGDLSSVTRVVAAIIFLLITAPISAHLLGRAAYINGVKPVKTTARDDYARYCREDSPFAHSYRSAMAGEEPPPRMDGYGNRQDVDDASGG